METIQQLTQLVAALRSEVRKFSVSPERVGAILQKIIDCLSEYMQKVDNINYPDNPGVSETGIDPESVRFFTDADENVYMEYSQYAAPEHIYTLKLPVSSESVVSALESKVAVAMGAVMEFGGFINSTADVLASSLAECPPDCIKFNLHGNEFVARNPNNLNLHNWWPDAENYGTSKGVAAGVSPRLHRLFVDITDNRRAYYFDGSEMREVSPHPDVQQQTTKAVLEFGGFVPVEGDPIKQTGVAESNPENIYYNRVRKEFAYLNRETSEFHNAWIGSGDYGRAAVATQGGVVPQQNCLFVLKSSGLAYYFDGSDMKQAAPAGFTPLQAEDLNKKIAELTTRIEALEQ